MHSKKDGGSKRYKVQCCLCHKVFNNDYKKEHERAVHQGKHVSVQTLGAPKNPFEVQKRKCDFSEVSKNQTLLCVLFFTILLDIKQDKIEK